MPTFSVYIQSTPNIPSLRDYPTISAMMFSAMNVWGMCANVGFTRTNNPNATVFVGSSSNSPALGVTQGDVGSRAIITVANNYEPWSKQSAGWCEDIVRRVMAHEAGHALRLPHTSRADQVMYGGLSKHHYPQAAFDVPAIQRLYGAKKYTPLPPPIPKKPEPTLPFDLNKLTEVATEFVGAAVSGEMLEPLKANPSTWVNNDHFVSELYRMVLGREPDKAGLKYWVGKLSK